MLKRSKTNASPANTACFSSLDHRLSYQDAGPRNMRPKSCPGSRQRIHSGVSGFSQTSFKPYLDASANFEKWPLKYGSTGLSTPKDKQLVVIDENEKKRPNIPKPRFLISLEMFIHNELQKIGITEESGESRLQVFREAFNLLIHHFKTYQPMFFAIKQEYEKMLGQQREEIRKSRPLKQRLVAVSEDYNNKIVLMRDRENREISDLQAKNKSLKDQIDTLEHTRTELEHNIQRLHRELETDYRDLRDEKDARRMLVVKLSDQQLRQEDMSVACQSYLQELEENKADPVVLKIALRGARTREKDLMSRIESLEREVTSYVNVVPSKDYEHLKNTNRKLNQEYKQTKQQMSAMETDFSELQAKYTEVREEKDRLQEELDNMNTRSLTPRPDWSRCAEHLDGGIVRWRELSRGKHSAELVSVVLRELTKTPGDGPDSVDDLMACKGSDSVLLLSCQLAILLTQHNMSTSQDGLIQRAHLLGLLEQFFPAKDPESLDALLKCVDYQLDTKGHDAIPYTKLFWEDDTGSLGEFLAELSTQFYHERREYLEDILEELGNIDPVSPEDLQRAITITDPEITSQDLHKYVCSAFMVRGWSQVAEAEPVPMVTLLGRLQKGMVRRIGSTGRREKQRRKTSNS